MRGSKADSDNTPQASSKVWSSPPPCAAKLAGCSSSAVLLQRQVTNHDNRIMQRKAVQCERTLMVSESGSQSIAIALCSIHRQRNNAGRTPKKATTATAVSLAHALSHAQFNSFVHSFIPAVMEDGRRCVSGECTLDSVCMLSLHLTYSGDWKIAGVGGKKIATSERASE